jgi:hypothetical protein
MKQSQEEASHVIATLTRGNVIGGEPVGEIRVPWPRGRNRVSLPLRSAGSSDIGRGKPEMNQARGRGLVNTKPKA